MQPSERGPEGTERPVEPICKTSWAELWKTGKNGFFLVLLGMAWWRGSIDSDGDLEPWNELLEDIGWGGAIGDGWRGGGWGDVTGRDRLNAPRGDRLNAPRGGRGQGDATEGGQGDITTSGPARLIVRGWS